MVFRQNHIFHGCYRVLWNLQQRKVQLSLLLQFLLFHYIFTAREEFIVLFNASQNISTSCFFLFEAKNGGNIHMLYFPLVCYAFFFKYLVRLWSFYLFFSGKQRNILLVHYCFYKIIFSVVFIETLNCFFLFFCIWKWSALLDRLMLSPTFSTLFVSFNHWIYVVTLAQRNRVSNRHDFFPGGKTIQIWRLCLVDVKENQWTMRHFV